MTLATFHTKVKQAANRGDTLDAIIPDYVQYALNWIETTYTFKHMERFVYFEIEKDDANPRLIPVPSGFKKMEFMRLIKEQRYKYLRRIDAHEVSDYIADQPSAFWMDGKEYFVLDCTPEEDYNAEMSYIGYTILPTDTTKTVPLIETDFPLLVITTAVVLLGPHIRDEKIIATYKAQRDDLMQAAVLADEELRNANTETQMIYGWEEADGIESA